MRDDQYVVIFGSYARGDFNSNSDIDILLINIDVSNVSEYVDLLKLPKLVINYVMYNTTTFNQYYSQGSLFLYHIFTQGYVLYGNELEWNRLSNGFYVKNNFYDELDKIKSEISVYENLDIFSNYYMSALSNLFPLLKNFCIFSLANDGVYIFNKDECVMTMFHRKKQEGDFLILRDFYDAFAKDINDIELKINPCSKEARLLIGNVYNYIRFL
ncbi:nucleotidyltransferase domain-containing protein [Yersinia enterocolitica]|uniref:nucleotidyltransferase domain-containing protein n=1 Tax=Yersinia enterocolitica TaxID=630 RepID=UPI0029B1841C|nr:nucleotidyltransferase domain-containing protein [Yersinia enterocolitica]HEI6834834.1 nucleotidyltransferase domain-containing protein [Yersinia enterocolitica]HEN3560610.1 nucleotidyltransferase domain-containing protein [Yersinia enterocolitica]